MDFNILKDIGFTSGEIKVYLALLKLGQSSTGPISKESQVSRSKVYNILDKLNKKGLVGSIMKGKINYFQAMPPKRILNFMDGKNKLFEKQRGFVANMISTLELKEKTHKLETKAFLYSGLKSIKNFYMGILDELSKGDSYYVIGASYGENQPGTKAFFKNYHAQRVKKKIFLLMLANSNSKNALVSTTYKHAKIRFLPQYLISNMIIVFYKNKSFIFFLSEEPIGFLIENKEITHGFKTYFDAFWKIARKN
ncbi:MAG TPA: helix-turn-helix domain-containing protein [Candidatus Nanoarchaeia archaeon]|nr:helix-turn-helix domain-containing protein [Candidatus Nanoarchaeia archaeon]